MTDRWRDDLRLKLEEMVDWLVIAGIEHKEVLRAASEEIRHLRQAYEQDPDPAEEDSVIEEPANDWPAAT